MQQTTQPALPRWPLLLPLLLTLQLVAPAIAQESTRPPGWLATQIDTLIDQSFQGTPAGPASSDTEWLRRIFLDLAGRIPTATETRSHSSPTIGLTKEYN
jgi:hypothetical protein